MYEGELITRMMSFGDNVKSTDADYRPRRRRHLQWAQDGYDQVWNAFDWGWKLKRGSLVFPTGSKEAPLPADYGAEPEGGGLFDGPKRLVNMQSQVVQDIQEGAISPGQSSITYAIYGWSDTLQRPVVQLNIAGPLTLVFIYNRKPPYLADKPWDGLPTAAVGAAGALTGTYQYIQVYETADGYLHEPSDVASVVLAAQRATVTYADPGPVGEHKVKWIRIYRTEAGGADLKLLTRLTYTQAKAAGFVLSDNALDGTLGEAYVEQSPLVQIPDQYHHTVLLASCMSKAKRSKGDTRDWAKDYQTGLADMIINERPRRSTIQRVPIGASPGMW